MGCSNLGGRECPWEEKCKEENKEDKGSWCAYEFGQIN